MARLLEIACFNLESALIAQRAGADRIEFCVDYPQGGISPPLELLEQVREKISIPLQVILRPRGGDFFYTEQETEWMLTYINLGKKIGVDGFVLGALTNAKQIDQATTLQLLKTAGESSVTFHRAIDECSDLSAALKTVKELGVKRVLTSGGKGSAHEHIPLLKSLQREFSNAPLIMPGGGIRSTNIASLLDTACTEYHSAALRAGSGFMADAGEIKLLKHFLEN